MGRLALVAVVVLLAAPACARSDGERGEALGARTIAFARDDGVYVGRADGSSMRRVTDIEGFEYQPDWSPDGSRIALRVDENPEGGVWIVEADGSNPRNVDGPAGLFAGVPDWSPDGRELAVAGKAEGDRQLGIYLLSPDGSRARRLTDENVEAQYPAWSPDGRRIAFTLVLDGGFDIYSISRDGSGLRRLTDDPAPDNWPEWSPDGDEIVFSSNRDDAEGLYLMNADGSNERLLAEGIGEPAWSPDGQWIAGNCAPGMCAVRVDGSDRRTLLGGGEGGFPAWKPASAR